MNEREQPTPPFLKLSLRGTTTKLEDMQMSLVFEREDGVKEIVSSMSFEQWMLSCMAWDAKRDLRFR